MTAYYNEFEPYAAQWLRNLITAGLIPAGEVDERSIAEVEPVDLLEFDQCHFFAGIDDTAAGHRQASAADAWGNARHLFGADGKARRVEPTIRLLAHGVPARVGRLRAYGNAIVPQVAAEVIGAFMECRP